MRRPNSGNPSSASLSGLMTPKMKKPTRATNTEHRLNALRRVRNFRDSSSAKYTAAHLNLTRSAPVTFSELSGEKGIRVTRIVKARLPVWSGTSRLSLHIRVGLSYCLVQHLHPGLFQSTRFLQKVQISDFLSLGPYCHGL